MTTPSVSKKFTYNVEIPVTTTDGDQFFEGWLKKTSEMHKVICKTFPHFEKIPVIGFFELVKNSYDQIIGSGLTIGDTLHLKIVIKQTDSGVVIKFKDNGTGFVSRSKGSRFTYEKETDGTPKDPDKGQLGGAKVGLEYYINDVNQYGNGEVTLKNRKDKGVSIEAFFPGSHKVNIPENN